MLQALDIARNYVENWHKHLFFIDHDNESFENTVNCTVSGLWNRGACSEAAAPFYSDVIAACDFRGGTGFVRLGSTKRAAPPARSASEDGREQQRGGEGEGRGKDPIKNSVLARGIGQSGTATVAGVPSFVPGRLPGQDKTENSWMVRVARCAESMRSRPR